MATKRSIQEITMEEAEDPKGPQASFYGPGGQKFKWRHIRKGVRPKAYRLKLNPGQLLTLAGQHKAAGGCEAGEECGLQILHYYESKEKWHQWKDLQPQGRAFKDSDSNEVRTEKVIKRACGRASPPGPCWCGMHKDKDGNPRMMVAPSEPTFAPIVLCEHAQCKDSGRCLLEEDDE